MKKISIVPIILLTLMLAGCGKNTPNEANAHTDIPKIETESKTVDKAALDSESIHLPIDKNKDVGLDYATAAANITGIKKEKSSASLKDAVSKKLATSKVSPIAKETPTVTPIPTVTPTPGITPSPVPVKQHDSITLTIQEEGKQILNCSVEIQDGGESLSSVMNRVADRIGMQLTNNGGYISCMNGRRASGFKGWVYSKNGVIPNIGISGQIVTKGDEIVWTYADHSDLIL